MAKPKLLDVVYRPEHWNQNCGCMIPAAWEALIDTGEYSPSLGENFVARLMADTRDDALARAHREYPGMAGGKDGEG